MASMTTYLPLYFLMVLLGATSCRSQDPIITLTANATYSDDFVGLREGESVMLTCHVQYLYGEVVGWFFRGTVPIGPLTNPSKYKVTTNGSLSTLTVSDLTRVQDAGNYSCVVYQGEIPRKRENLEILVFYFPDDIYPICNGSVIVTEGEQVTFRCESEPGDQPVDLAWKRDFGTIQGSIRTGVENGKKFANYTFVPSKLDNGMTAYCTISSNAIFKERTSNCSVGPLSVQYPPTDISLTNQNVSYSNSTYGAILCKASAFPDIFYTWSFNTFLDSSQQTLINGNQTLVILNVKMCEFPIIATCQASNDIGHTAANYTLCEPLPPPNPVCYPKNQVVLTEGVPVMFQCVSYSDEDNPTGVVWSRDKGQISADNITTGDLPNNFKYSNYTYVPMRDDIGINVTCSLQSSATSPDYCTIGPLLIQHIPSDAAMTTVTSKLITSNGLASTRLPITTTDQDTTISQPFPLAYVFIIVLMASMVLIALLISVCYFAQTSCCSRKMDMNKTDKESLDVQLIGDSRILNDVATRGSSSYTADSAMDNPVFEMEELNTPQEQPHKWFEFSIFPLEEVANNMSPNNPGEGQVQTQDNSNNTDFENDSKNPESDPENEDDGSQGKEQVDASQGQDKNQEEPASDVEAVDEENFTDDGNQGNNQPDEEDSDPENPSSEPKDEDDQVEDEKAIDEDDIMDDETMVEPAIIEVETELNPDDPRKSTVQEALLATQVNFLENEAKRGFKKKP